ncbi:hypothetical protein LOZ58_002609 [Ophidiomyces ophidiicola]|nr:hypothetical protein LOZ58_002609 [Ophidiomyces ophidiicola]
MSSKFAFGFGDDDIAIDEYEDEQVPAGKTSNLKETCNETGAALHEACRVDMSEMLSSLPSQISYNTLYLSDPLDFPIPVTIPRREVFDIRAQLMAEDSLKDNLHEEMISGLETGDITPLVYEGGFKTWECAQMLALYAGSQYLYSDRMKHDWEFIELGAGTAIPSLFLLKMSLDDPLPTVEQEKRRISFVFADYNIEVLKLVTLPNIILTWYFSKHPKAEPASEIDVNLSLLESFQKDLSARGISLSFISGAWSPRLVDLIASVSDANETRSFKTFILASETIYSPTSLVSFAETLSSLLLQRHERNSGAFQDQVKPEALVAAKELYFGVGGGVDEFLVALESVAGSKLLATRGMETMSPGVRLTVLNIRP